MPSALGNVPRPGTSPHTRPVLYLDIDGVLNPLGPGEDLREETIGNLTVRIRDEHQAWLTDLSEHYDLVWATTWEHHANDLFAPLLGLPELPYVSFTEYEARPDDPRTGVMQIAETRKWAPILRHANGRRFAWLDDVIPFRLKRQAWPHRGILLIRVDPWTGLTERHISRLRRWA